MCKWAKSSKEHIVAQRREVIQSGDSWRQCEENTICYKGLNGADDGAGLPDR